MSNRSKSVPKAAQAVYDAVVALTDAFCSDHLTLIVPVGIAGACPQADADLAL